MIHSAFLSTFAKLLLAASALLLGPLTEASHAQVRQGPGQLEVDERFGRIVIIATEPQQEVNEVLFTRLRDALDKAAAYERAAVVIEIDSGGGRVDSARAIVDLIRRYREDDDFRIFAYVPRQALSAAAWIALACRGIIMAPDAQIGDIQPITMGYRGIERAPEKIVTALTEEIWLTSRDNGLDGSYPELFVKAMVDRDLEIAAVENPRLGTVSYMRSEDWDAMTERERSGLVARRLGLPSKALTTNGADLVEYGFRIKLVRDRHEITDWLGTPDAVVERETLSLGSSLGVNIDWTWLFLVVGFLCLFLELKAPGLGLFGVLGVVCFIGFFLAQSGWTQAAVLPIGLFLAGALLLLVEAIILPGLIVPGVLGFLLVLYATYVGVANDGSGHLPFPNLSNDDDAHGVTIWAGMITASLLGGFAISVAFGKVIHRLPLLQRLVLLPPGLATVPGARDRTGEAASATGSHPVQVGARGEAVTELKPSGVARVGSFQIDVVTTGGFIERRTAIEVVDVSGNRVVVRELKPGAESA